MSIAWRKFSAAIHALGGLGTKRECLVSAYVYNLIDLKNKEIPKEVRATFEELVKRISYGAIRFDKNVAKKAIENMDDREIAKTVAEMIAIHEALTQYQPICNRVTH